jgi:hypothetical protein
MKSLIFTILSFLAITANAQTIASNTEIDLIVDIPMMGNIKVDNCDEKLLKALKMITIMKVINKSEKIQFIINETQEEIFAVSFDKLNDEEKQVVELLQ